MVWSGFGGAGDDLRERRRRERERGREKRAIDREGIGSGELSITRISVVGDDFSLKDPIATSASSGSVLVHVLVLAHIARLPSRPQA